MIKLTKKINAPAAVNTTLTLPLESRVKSRQRVLLDNGNEAGLFLERGTTLKDGELLASDEGFIVQIKAADEILSVIRCYDELLLAKVCYHLGNRHVPLQIELGRVSYLHDHVLDDMLRGLGLDVNTEKGPFEPEPGAYGGHASGGHGHGHHHH